MPGEGGGEYVLPLVPGEGGSMFFSLCLGRRGEYVLPLVSGEEGGVCSSPCAWDTRLYATKKVAISSLSHCHQTFYERTPNGLAGALEDLGIKFNGRQHCGRP